MIVIFVDVADHLLDLVLWQLYSESTETVVYIIVAYLLVAVDVEPFEDFCKIPFILVEG